MSMTGGYSSMAEAVGETAWQRGECPPPSPSWTGAELAEMHEDDLAGVEAAMERSAHDRLRWYEQENARLRARLAELDPEQGEDAHLDAAYEDRWDYLDG